MCPCETATPGCWSEPCARAARRSRKRKLCCAIVAHRSVAAACHEPRRRRRGSASHLAHHPSREPASQVASATQARRRGETHLSARCRRRSKSPFFAPASRIPRLPIRFRATPRVASLAWVAAATWLTGLPTDRDAKCAWKRHGVTFPAEGISRRRVADGRRVRTSHRPRGSHAFRCVSGLRRASRRSHGSLQQPAVAVSQEMRCALSAQRCASPAGSGGAANNEGGATASVDKTRSRPPPRRPSLV